MLLVIYGFLIILGIFLLLVTGFSAVVVVALLVLGVVMTMFANLTISVDETKILAEFYLGFPRRTIRISEITGIAIVRNRWYYGLGIRLTPHGWLYAVSGLSAIEFELQNGKKIRFGTDEPEALAKAIETARSSWMNDSQ